MLLMLQSIHRSSNTVVAFDKLQASEVGVDDFLLSPLEEPYGRDYADYTFMAPRRILIVEAKKEGDYFEVPAEKDRLEYSLSALMRDYPHLKAAIEQATGYCQSRGIPFGAVSNGHQIVAFVATRSDGLPPLRGKPWSSFLLTLC